ncbi:lysine--tRNA ligase [Clostridium sp. D2Q-11]|uniref:Lysine--tRNA ligase n=1 Tax=Anaeromonas frigoriresistens TaxID=2683708 RepID=A0A942UXF5_9FIRM|nr:lysine--tRNA ligase [Anaeromonas frigoriresistens]MBS4539350.1 lysine--tRNA ligase [Anaeromonas frigoriresistens]
MHWSQIVAEEIINKYPEKETYVCASGISPSGSVHIGNFREIITTYFVVKSLDELGKKTRFIFSWDDYDRFRKVPKNIDRSFEKYIGMPYSEIPDPYGCHESYAEHFEKEFEEALDIFGIDVEFIYQSEEYKSGRYNKYILHALKARKKIYDILMEFKTQEPCEKDRNNFYPITLYCNKCRKDDTKIVDFNELTEVMKYNCKCGNEGSEDVLKSENIKLNWKVDWPMRWMVEDVVFEPGGRDHSSETGSYNVSKKIVDKIFNHPAPEYIPYEFIGIKGVNGKMSSSQGNALTPKELLNIYIPELILFMFAKYNPSSAFNIGFDEDVIKNYTEYERYKSSFSLGKLNNEDICYTLELASVDDNNSNLPRFNQVAGVLPLINFEDEILREVLRQNGEVYAIDNIKEISNRAEYWIKNYNSKKVITLKDKRDNDYYNTLSEKERGWLKELCIIIRNSEDLNSDELMSRIYSICDNEDKKLKRNNQKRLFNIIYRLILNGDSGPRISLLIKTIGVGKSIYLLGFS